jgi:hypothetical protein
MFDLAIKSVHSFLPRFGDQRFTGNILEQRKYCMKNDETHLCGAQL